VTEVNVSPGQAPLTLARWLKNIFEMTFGYQVFDIRLKGCKFLKAGSSGQYT